MDQDKKHIFLAKLAEPTPFTSTVNWGKSPTYPPRDRVDHAAYIERRLEQAWEQAKEEQEARSAVAVSTRHGTYLEFEGAPGFDLKTESLENRRNGIRLMNVRTETSFTRSEDGRPAAVTKATVFIPTGRERFFLEKVRQYKEEEVEKSGKPKNQGLVDSVQDIHVALAEALWTDERRLYPDDDPVVCEVWLQGDEPKVEKSFRSVAGVLDIPVQAGSLRFPERTVVLANANREQLGQLLAACDNLAEYRRAKTTAGFWTESSNADQVDWSRSLLDRLEVNTESGVAVSILDTGANNGHVLLTPLLEDDDLHACDPTWGVHDHHGHGTLMCGLAGYGDLQQALEGTGTVYVAHRLESVKILPPHGQNDPKFYGYLTSQAASRVEIKAPHRKHVFCLAVTSEDGRDRGRPTSWSAALDALASGQNIGQLAPGATTTDNEPESDDEKRLIIVSAGNVDDPNEWSDYSGSNLRSPIHDPAQSWNALAVGAYTEKTFLSDQTLAGYVPVAPSGGLSPFSSTSLTWDNKWPAKPDVLMEGGNVVRDTAGLCTACDDTSILSTSHQPTLRQFDTIYATSAATAQAAWMAARIQTIYPQAWPETVRGLMVHSADWTEQMRRAFLGSGTKKTDYAQLLRVCGYGVPDLQRALYCASNSLTLIAQDTLQPFDKKENGSGYRTKDMHLHELPWPKEVLESLGDAELTMRITLSYFVEPSPGEVGWKDRYRYQSHALRFDLNNPLENRRQFLVRLNRAARDDGEVVETSSDSDRWLIGSTGRSRGSIHSDIWKGPAADLAACNLIGVYPVIGWWRERAWLNCWNKRARYSLIVSLHSPELGVDIYTPVAVAVEAAVMIPGW